MEILETTRTESPEVIPFIRYEYAVVHMVAKAQDPGIKQSWEEYKEECPPPLMYFQDHVIIKQKCGGGTIKEMWVVEGFRWYVEGLGPDRHREVIMSRTRHEGDPMPKAIEPKPTLRILTNTPEVRRFIRFEYEVSHAITWSPDWDTRVSWEACKKGILPLREAYHKIVLGEERSEDLHIDKILLYEGYCWFVEGKGSGRYREIISSRKEVRDVFPFGGEPRKLNRP